MNSADPALLSDTVPQPARSRGRPSLYSPAVAGAICEFIRLCGASLSHAAAYAGINPKTVRRWRAERPEFAEAVEAARGEFLTLASTRINHARLQSGRPDWRAQAWLLARIFPEEYGALRPVHAPSELPN